MVMWHEVSEATVDYATYMHLTEASVASKLMDKVAEMSVATCVYMC